MSNYQAIYIPQLPVRCTLEVEMTPAAVRDALQTEKHYDLGAWRGSGTWYELFSFVI